MKPINSVLYDSKRLIFKTIFPAIMSLFSKIKKLTFFCGKKIKYFSKFVISSIGRYSFAYLVFSILGIVVFFVKKQMPQTA